MRAIILALASMLALGAPAFAQDWVVNRVRGNAEMLVGSAWVPVERGVVIEPRRTLRTGPDGRVGLSRGNETIELGGDTEISLRDGGAELKTSVIQDRGTLTIDVERRNVQHFSVQTPFLAAVVKGTRFSVTVGDNSAQVDVERGLVQVQDTANDLVTDIGPGRQATVGEDKPLNVSGGGNVAIFTFEGDLVVPGTTEVVDPAADQARSGVPGNGPPAHASAGDNANGGNSGKGPPEHSNAGGNRNESGTVDGPPAHSNAGGNGNGHGGGNGPPEHSNAGGNRSEKGNGPPAHSNASGNGKGRE